jgi:uncharacterized protein (TIGR02145 family)
MDIFAYIYQIYAQYIKTDSGRNNSGLYIGQDADFKLSNNNNPSNLIIGIGAGYSLMSKPNTAISGYHNDNNVIIGNHAGVNLRADENANGGMSATLNVLVGNYVGEQMGAKSLSNTFIGWETARFSSASDWGGKLEGNVAIGGRALQYAKKANGNVVLGDNSFLLSTNVNSNVALGINVGNRFLKGDNNVLVGSGALDSVSSGNNNIIIGSNAISKLNGDANVLIGYNVADQSNDSISNKLYIANSNTKTPLIYGEFDKMKLAINGKLIVGTSSVTTSSAILEASSTSQGFLPPRMTTIQRDSIINPAEGLIIFNKTTNSINYNTSLGWISLSASAADALPTIQIGTQKWMSKNLDVAFYRNGDPIPQVADATAWSTLTTGAWCYYNNDSTLGNKYGKLYNWYAVNDPRGLAPLGWHIPSDTEWFTLENTLGGYSVDGGLMKEAGTINWASPNYAGNNNSGWTGLPGGYRNLDGTFLTVTLYGYWWSATEIITTNALHRDLWYPSSHCGRSNSSKLKGMSVRCLRD